MQSLTDDFERKTRLALADLLDQADKVRRNLPAGHVCADSSRCRNCEALYTIHARLDDHCVQLDDYRATRTLEAAL